VRLFALALEEEKRGWYLMHRPGAEADPPFRAFRTWLGEVAAD
jgi:LysR family glycine cleavage system transcriptional activator/LysR family transcriptional regulator of beta-lactamase